MLHTTARVVVGLQTLSVGLIEESDRLIRGSTSLTLTQTLIIGAIIREGCVRQEEIARLLRVTQPAVSKQLRKLFDSGFLEESLIDRRSQNPVITALGKAEYDKAFAIYDSYCQSIFSRLSESELNELETFLTKLNSTKQI